MTDGPIKRRPLLTPERVAALRDLADSWTRRRFTIGDPSPIAGDAVRAALDAYEESERRWGVLREALVEARAQIGRMAAASGAGFSCSVVDDIEAALAATAGRALLAERDALRNALRLNVAEVKRLKYGKPSNRPECLCCGASYSLPCDEDCDTRIALASASTALGEP